MATKAKKGKKMETWTLNSRQIKKVFGQNLRKRLSDKDMNQRDLAEVVGISPVNIHRWVNGLALPQPRMLAIICNVLECTPDYLMKDHYAG